MSNRFFIVFVCVIGLTLPAKAQHYNCGKYHLYVREAEKALAETPKNYVLAVQKYLNATFCNPDSAKIQQIQAKIDGLFIDIGRLEAKAKADARRSEQLTRQARADQDSARLALRNYFFDEAELQFHKTVPNYRLAYLLSKEALKYDAQFLPAQKLTDTIFNFCPMNMETIYTQEEKSEKEENEDEWANWKRKNEFAYGYQFERLSDSVFLAIEGGDYHQPYIVHLLDQKGNLIWRTSCSSSSDWGYYDKQQDWLVIYGETNPVDFLKPYQIYSLKTRQVIRHGNPTGWIETYPAGLFPHPVLAEHLFEKTLFYSLPDFKLIDSIPFIESRFCKDDSLWVFAQTNGVLTDSADLYLAEFYQEQRYGEEQSKWHPFDTIKITIVKKNGSVISKTIKAQRIKTGCGEAIFCFNPDQILVLGVPELDTLFFQSPTDFADVHKHYRIAKGMVEGIGLILIGREGRNGLDIKVVNKKQPGKILLERQNLIGNLPILRNHLFSFQYRCPDGSKPSELIKYENGQFTSLGQWQEFKYLEKEKLVLGWSAQKTEVFRLDSTVEKGYRLFPLMELVGGVVNKKGSWSDEIYFWPVWGQKKIYNIITLTADGEYHMSVVDKGYKLLHSLAIGKDVNLYELSMDEGFLYSYEDPDYQRVISKTYFARPFSNMNTRFRYNEEVSHSGNFWVFQSRDEIEEQDFLRIIQIEQGKMVRHDSIPYSGAWDVREVNGKRFLTFDRKGDLFTYELGNFKRPFRHWPGVDSWEFLSQTDDPILSIHQNPVIGYIDEETKGTLNFDLTVFNLKNGQSNTYPNKTNKERVWRAKGGDNAPLLSYLEMKTNRNDSVWIEVVALADFKTVLPYTLVNDNKYRYPSVNRVEFIELSENHYAYILTKEPERAGWRYSYYEFPSMRLIDSIPDIGKIDKLENPSNRLYNQGCLLQNQNAEVFHIRYAPYRRTFLRVNDSTQLIVRDLEGIFALPSGGDSLFFYDTYKPDLPLIATFKHPDIYSNTLIQRNHNGFVFTTGRDESLTVWHYAKNMNQFKLLKSGISSWEYYDMENLDCTTLHKYRNSYDKRDITTYLAIDSMGAMQLGGQTYPAFLARKKMDIKPFFLDNNHYWGVVQDTVHQTFLIRLFEKGRMKCEGRNCSYYILKDSIPNVTQIFLKNQSDAYYKFLTNDPRGNLCLCPEADLPKLNCTYYQLPLENKALYAMLRVSDDLLLTFDESAFSKTSEIIVDAYTLIEGKKLRSLRLKSDGGWYYKENTIKIDKWKVSKDGKWLTYDYRDYSLLSRDAFDKMMFRAYNFNSDEKAQFGIDE